MSGGGGGGASFEFHSIIRSGIIFSTHFSASVKSTENEIDGHQFSRLYNLVFNVLASSSCLPVEADRSVECLVLDFHQKHTYLDASK